MALDCRFSISIFYTIICVLVIIFVGTVIGEGKSEKKKISWVLYAFGIIFGMMGIILLFTMKKCKGTSLRMVQFVVPAVTIIMTMSNMVGMIMAKPKLSVQELIVPHMANMLLLLSSLFIGYSACRDKDKPK